MRHPTQANGRVINPITKLQNTMADLYLLDHDVISRSTMTAVLKLIGLNAVVVHSGDELLRNDLHLNSCSMVHRWAEQFQMFELSRKEKQRFPDMNFVHIASLPAAAKDLVYLMRPFDTSE